MAMPSEEKIRQFILDQYRLWGEDRLDEMMTLIREMAPQGYTIEYVGGPVLDGASAMADMIATHGGKIATDVGHLIVNGCEAAAMINNHVRETGATVVSLEVYKFGDGTFHARYFHQ